MIYGVGVDCVEIDRIEQLFRKHEDLSRLFGEAELKMTGRAKAAESFAANFCAKEAFAKALGTGVKGFRLREVQLLRDRLGKPYYLLTGNAQRIAEEKGLVFHVSVTHSDKIAAAFTVAEKSIAIVGKV